MDRPVDSGGRAEGPDMPPDEEAVPLWALAAIVLGLTALSGWPVALALVGTAVVLWWLVVTEDAGTAGRHRTAGRSPRQPWGRYPFE